MHEIHQILGMFKKILPRKLDHSSIIKVLRVDFLEKRFEFLDLKIGQVNMNSLVEKFRNNQPFQNMTKNFRQKISTF